MSVQEERKPFFHGSSVSSAPLPASSSTLPSFAISTPQQSRRRFPSRICWRLTLRDVLFLLSGTLIGCILFKLAFTASNNSRSSHPHGEGAGKPVLDFLVVGDWGRKGLYNQSQVAVQMGRVGKQLGVDFVISTGDNFYQTGLHGTSDLNFATSFTNVYTSPSLQTTWYAVLGNHDYMGDALSQISDEMVKRDWRWFCRREFEVHRDLCHTREPCKESVDLFFTDTNTFVDEYFSPDAKYTFDWRGLAPRQQQLRSQLQRLTHKLDRSNASWKFVIGHHTVRSVGHHGDTPELVDQMLPILERYKVDAYINGHDHNLQHIKRSNGSVHFFTSGGGSKAFKGLRPYDNDAGVHFVFDGQGFLAISVTPTSALFQFYDVFGEVMYSYHMDR